MDARSARRGGHSPACWRVDVPAAGRARARAGPRRGPLPRPRRGRGPAGGGSAPRWTRRTSRASSSSSARPGIGGVEVCPIYGVKGWEDRNIPFLSHADGGARPHARRGEAALARRRPHDRDGLAVRRAVGRRRGRVVAPRARPPQDKDGRLTSRCPPEGRSTSSRSRTAPRRRPHEPRGARRTARLDGAPGSWRIYAAISAGAGAEGEARGAGRRGQRRRPVLGRKPRPLPAPLRRGVRGLPRGRPARPVPRLVRVLRRELHAALSSTSSRRAAATTCGPSSRRSSATATPTRSRAS